MSIPPLPGPPPDGPNDLVIEVTLPIRADAVHFFLFPGTLTPTPSSRDQLEGLSRIDPRSRSQLVGGCSGVTCSARLRGVDPGTYTLCVVPSAPTHPDQAAYIAEVVARYSAEVAEQTAEAFTAFIAKVKREPGFKTFPADFSNSVARCYPVEVTEDPSSRLVAIES